ncbi:hypothetical protein EON80_02370, partial [bacterium]
MSNLLDPASLPESPDSHVNGLSRSVVVSDRSVVSPLASDAPHGYPYEEEESINFKKIIAVAIRRWKMMACIFLAIVTVVTIFSVLSPRVYQATAQVIINSENNKNNSAFGALPAGVAQMLTGANGRSQDTEIQILQSQPVRKAALDLLPQTQRTKPISGLEVRPVGSTDIVTVSASSTDPNFAQDFTNRLCEAYVKQSQEESNRQYTDSANYVSEQLVSLKDKLDTASDDLMRYKERNGITDLAAETTARVEQIKILQNTLQQARVEQLAGQSQLQNLLSSARTTPNSEIAPSVIARRPVVQQYEQQLTTLQSQLIALRGEFRSDAPEIRAIEDQIKRVKAQLQSEPQTQVQQYSRNV